MKSRQRYNQYPLRDASAPLSAPRSQPSSRSRRSFSDDSRLVIIPPRTPLPSRYSLLPTSIPTTPRTRPSFTRTISSYTQILLLLPPSTPNLKHLVELIYKLVVLFGNVTTSISYFFVPIKEKNIRPRKPSLPTKEISFITFLFVSSISSILIHTHSYPYYCCNHLPSMGGYQLQ